MTIHVTLSNNIQNIKGRKMSIYMIPFIGEAEGEYFKGTTTEKGVDTQKIYPDGKIEYSARYMLEGEDYKGNRCSVFIENNGVSLENCTPFIVTDSKELQFLAEAKLISNVTPKEYGIDVRIYKFK